jgi:hypothetical protein
MTDDISSLESSMLGFEAPYLEGAYLRTGLARTHEQAAELFSELKKYLFLASRCHGPAAMVSGRVDAAWHQFILHTKRYAAFCELACGRFLHHAPSGEPVAVSEPGWTSLSEFAEVYRPHFGELSRAWHDEDHLRTDTRLARAADGCDLTVEVRERHACLLRARRANRPDGEDLAREIVCRTSLRGQAALEFISRHDMFLIRELVGLAQPEQQQLAQSLVQHEILKAVWAQ